MSELSWRAGDPYEVVVGTPVWTLNGVNTFSANLVRGLRRRGVDASVLLTRPHQHDTKPMPVPEDLPFRALEIEPGESRARRWDRLVEELEARAPCVWLPNNDYEASCVCPVLPSGVTVVGIAHSDDDEHYDHVARLGRYWDAVVGVSETVSARIAATHPGLAERLHTIPYGVDLAEDLPARDDRSRRPLRLVYAGRLDQRQKRIYDLLELARTLRDRDVPFHLTILGGGGLEGELRKRLSRSGLEGSVRLAGILPPRAVLETFEEHDVFVLASAFEGLPLVLLEAMGRGLVPVVTRVASGVGEVVRDGSEGLLVPVGRPDLLAEGVERLHRDRRLLEEMSERAFGAVHRGGYGVDTMAERYESLFEQVLGHASAGRFRRPAGRILPPPAPAGAWKSLLPGPVRSFARLVKRALGGGS